MLHKTYIAYRIVWLPVALSVKHAGRNLAPVCPLKEKFCAASFHYSVFIYSLGASRYFGGADGDIAVISFLCRYPQTVQSFYNRENEFIII